MKVWYDACTGKHVRYGVAIGKRLRALGHTFFITIRKHPDTVPLADYLNEKVVVVGRYDPQSLLSRLEESARRQLSFSKILKKDMPDVAISHGSVDLCRVAFGLGTPCICTFDTPHAKAVTRLTLPLVNDVVMSRAIPKEIVRKYNAEARISSFNGVDELAWIKNLSKTEYEYEKPLVVVRQIETKAVYAKKGMDMLTLAKKLTRLGKVVFLTRYERKEIRDLIVPKSFVDSASLVAQADLFVGAGGTITREAALQGTPSIVIKMYPGYHVNEFLRKKGFPIHETDPSSAVKLAEELVGRRKNVKHLLAKLEDPVDVIAQILRNFHEAKTPSQTRGS
ncbi:DUF354 domain-containing protein [Candidatus Bathyarchaeota archaeon]|nr:DUF354 domain-containing protein [Candidatus Bathyarchaeota archaeon]